jgi:hypothetical protein
MTSFHIETRICESCLVLVLTHVPKQQHRSQNSNNHGKITQNFHIGGPFLVDCHDMLQSLRIGVCGGSNASDADFPTVGGNPFRATHFHRAIPVGDG